MVKSLTNKSIDVNSIGSILLILLGFSLPLSVAVNNILAIILTLLWVYNKNYVKSWEYIKNSKFLIALLVFYFLHILGLLWTEDMKWGMYVTKKESLLLFIPIFMTFIKKDHIKYYISSFLLAITLSEFLSYMVWFEIIPPILKASVYNPTIFMHHTSYNPFLAFAVYITGYMILFSKDITKLQKVLFILFFITMSVNMFITGGRAGQVGYLIMLIVLLFQYFNKNIIKSILSSIIILSTILFGAYTVSNIFHDRVNLAVSEVVNFDSNKNVNTSVGLRINFAINSLEIIKNNPLVGVGTGDFKNSYEKINAIRTPNAISTVQPHNMYILVTTQLGIIGLASLVMMLFYQILFAKNSKNELISKLGFALPILFALIMLSDSYLFGHSTTMLFIYFSSILYRPHDETN